MYVYTHRGGSTTYTIVPSYTFYSPQNPEERNVNNLEEQESRDNSASGLVQASSESDSILIYTCLSANASSGKARGCLQEDFVGIIP